MSAKRTSRKPSDLAVPVIRCAIYTRKSTSDGLEQEFNSLDAQREACEAYVKSQVGLGWTLIPKSYDDGGFTGSNMDRPALQQLLTDIEAGKVDCVVVYKIDRLSRSLMDFARLIGLFDHHNVAFVSVTQQFNTGSSTGRLMLNILLSFAQFEREMIAERTRDKMQLARRKGRWTGGPPMLGYDIDPNGGSLVINADEASQVRQLFDWYLETKSLVKTAHNANQRGWTTKAWQLRDGRFKEGRPWDKGILHRHLSNPVYIGKVRPGGELMEGMHEAIVEEKAFWKAQETMKANRTSGGSDPRNRHGAILRGLLHCGACGNSMGHTHTRKKGRLYRYYQCNRSLKLGKALCPAPAIPAAEIEAFMAHRLSTLGQNPALVEATASALYGQRNERKRQLLADQRKAQQARERATGKLSKTSDLFGAGVLDADEAGSRIAKCRDEISRLDAQLEKITAQLESVEREGMDVNSIRLLLGDFDRVWEVLVPAERQRVIELLIDRIEVDSTNGRIAVQFHAEGLGLLGMGESSQEAVQ